MRVLILFVMVLFYACQHIETGYEEHYENGNLKLSVPLKNGKKHGELRAFYENGDLKTMSEWKDGIRNGKHLEYYRDSAIKEQKLYSNGKIVDTIFEYYKSRSIKKITVLHSDSIFGYYSNGEIYYRGKLDTNGQPNGIIKYYYTNGKIRQIESLSAGKYDGEQKIFYPNGQMKELTHYTNNKKIGESLFYDSLGMTMKSSTSK